MTFASIYPLYINKVERKGRTQEELDLVISWLTGYDQHAIHSLASSAADLRTFFEEAPQLNPDASKIKGMICGHRIEDIQEPLMQKIRYMDKLVDELAKGRSVDRITHR